MIQLFWSKDMIKDKKGQALVEYILIIALVSVIAIALVNFLGGYLSDAITKSSCAMVGEEYQKGEKPGEGKCVAKTDDIEENKTKE